MTRRSVWVITGKGRCAGTTTYVLAETAEAARARLLREDASPFYEVGTIEPLRVVPAVGSDG